MKYQGQTDFDHAGKHTIGVLLTNLGTPEAPTRKALRKYLKQFLWDPRVVEVPRPVWWLILNGIILNLRPGKSAKLYQSIWTDEGSPLMVITKKQCDALAVRLGNEQDIIVDYAMRYGKPSIDSALQRLQQAGAHKIIVLPLYPQYSGATTGSTFDAVAAALTQSRWVPDLRFIANYHDHPLYIKACAEKIRDSWQQHGKPQKLLFSYHGLPKRYLDNGDPYFCHCHKTSRLLADQLGIAEDDYLTCFQSRFGREEWLKPYTDETLQQLPAQGIKSVQVFCPGFAADCLETLEEIAVLNQGIFKEAGGEEYHYIPALNDDELHVDVLAALLQANLAGWDLPGEEGRQTRIEQSSKPGLPYIAG